MPCGSTSSHFFSARGSSAKISVTAPPSSASGSRRVIRRVPSASSIATISTLSSKRTSSRMRNHRGVFHSGRKVASFRSEEHTSELQSLMRISYAVFCLKKKTKKKKNIHKRDRRNTKVKKLTKENISPGITH